MRLLVELLAQVPVARRSIELVERKGLGHPDTICDALVEAVSIGLNAMYREHAGAILHYNVDKALLAAGECRKAFGHGTLTRPMELVLGDRATFELRGRRLPVEETVRSAVNAWVAASLPHVRPGLDLATRLVLAPGSEELTRIFREGAQAIASNDTCGASGYAPLSPTEQLVLDIERWLNGSAFKRDFPDTGEDVKVLAVREGAHVMLTVAMPFRCDAVASERAYFARKDEVLAALGRRFAGVPFTTEWRLNNLDRPGAGESGAYLTLLGTSAEDADSGQVGRGNRPNGLIAFARPAGAEAAPGKNPVAHAGKVYSVLSHRLAALVHARCPEAEEVYVHLAARIGEPVDHPWAAVQLVLGRGAALGDFEPTVREVVEAELERLPAFREELIRGEHPVC